MKCCFAVSFFFLNQSPNRTAPGLDQWERADDWAQWMATSHFQQQQQQQQQQKDEKINKKIIAQSLIGPFLNEPDGRRR